MLGLALTTLALTPVFADDKPVLEEVTVTAQKRAQSLQDVPLSVNAIAGDKLEKSDITDLADLTSYVPNFSKSDTSIGQYLVIRGISSGINQGFEQSVVQFVDDIALSRSNLARMPFMDLERVEVLRGPQNVLFGKNAIGGAISMVTAKPTEELMARGLLEYTPNWDGYSGTAVVSGPFTESLRGRLAVRYAQDDGYFDNNLTGNEEPNREESAIRGIVDWDVTDSFSASLKLETSRIDFRGRNDEMVFTYQNPVPQSPFYGLTYPQIAMAVGQLAATTARRTTGATPTSPSAATTRSTTRHCASTGISTGPRSPASAGTSTTQLMRRPTSMLPGSTPSSTRRMKASTSSARKSA